VSLASQAIDEADAIIGTVFKLGRAAVVRRRKEADWRYVRASRRVAYARTRAEAWWWGWRARHWRAIAEANKAFPDLCCKLDDELAKMPGGSGGMV
jgi:hypothetical protein